VKSRRRRPGHLRRDAADAAPPSGMSRSAPGAATQVTLATRRASRRKPRHQSRSDWVAASQQFRGERLVAAAASGAAAAVDEQYYADHHDQCHDGRCDPAAVTASLRCLVCAHIPSTRTASH
jgi:hypothetical protein